MYLYLNKNYAGITILSVDGDEYAIFARICEILSNNQRKPMFIYNVYLPSVTMISAVFIELAMKQIFGEIKYMDGFSILLTIFLLIWNIFSVYFNIRRRVVFDLDGMGFWGDKRRDFFIALTGAVVGAVLSAGLSVLVAKLTSQQSVEHRASGNEGSKSVGTEKRSEP